MSVASRLIEKLIKLGGAGRALSDRGFYRTLRRNAIRARKGEKLRSLSCGVKVETGVYCGMRYYLFRPRNIDTTKSVMYLHGSGYLYAHRFFHERFAADLAKNTHAKVYFPIYPKLPAERAAACFAVLNNFYAFLSRKGEVILVGDSSGGALSLALASERSEVRRVVAISPWLILPPCREAREAREDVVLSLDMLERVAALWACGLSERDPKVSPFYGRYEGKEILLFAGEKERFSGEITRFVTEKKGECARLECLVGEGQQHCYPLMPTPEGRDARREIYRQLHEWLYGGRKE